MTSLRVSVLGTGDMGGAIATALSKRTKHVIAVRGSHLGSASAVALTESLGVSEATDQVIDQSDVVFVVTPVEALPQVFEQLANYRGVVVSVAGSDTIGRDGKGSVTERVAAALPQARVVHAFTSVWASVVRDPGTGPNTSVFVCTDHDDARKLASGVIADMGFAPMNAGPLEAALFAEAFGMLIVRLGEEGGYGERITVHAFQAT